MNISSRTPEGEPNHCPICGSKICIEPSTGFRDAPCPCCGHLLLFSTKSLPEPPSEQTCDEQAKAFRNAAKFVAEGQWAMAAELLAGCVIASPANIGYVHSYIGALHEMYNFNRKGVVFARFREQKTRTALREARERQDWDAVVKNGVTVLAVNPWDVSTLLDLALASNRSGNSVSALLYLKYAHEVDPGDPETGAHLANALSAVRESNQDQ